MPLYSQYAILCDKAGHYLTGITSHLTTHLVTYCHAILVEFAAFDHDSLCKITQNCIGCDPNYFMQIIPNKDS